MKSKLLVTIYALLTATMIWADVRVNRTNFPDENFLNWIKSQSYGADYVLTEDEMAGVEVVAVEKLNIKSLKGIEHFTALKVLYCSGNQLTALDLSKNIALEELDCSNNLLTSLNVSGCVALTDLSCFQNKLMDEGMDALIESLPTVSGGVMNFFFNANEQNRMTFEQASAVKQKGWTPMYLDDDFNWCEYFGWIVIDESSFPDEIFRSWVLSQDYGLDGKLSGDEIANITSVNVSYIRWTLGADISNLQGIEYFSSLTELDCRGNSLAVLDMLKNTALQTLDCSSNQLTELNVSGNLALQKLNCSRNHLFSLDVSKNLALQTLDCSYNAFYFLDVSNNLILQSLNCSSNRLYSLDVSKNIELLWLNYSNTPLTTLDLSKNIALTGLDCSGNQLTSLDVSKNPELNTLYCSENQIKGEAMDALVASLPFVSDGKIYVIYPYSSNEQNVMTTIQVAVAKAKGWTPYYYHSVYSNPTYPTYIWSEYEGSYYEMIAINEENFPDEDFRGWILNQDFSHGGKLSGTDIIGITGIDISSNMTNGNIRSLKGIEYFSMLTELNCSGNKLTTLDISKNILLKKLDCSCNQIKDEGMDVLVESLPTVINGTMNVIYDESEQNVMTTTQVTTARAKGWIPCYFVRRQDGEYGGDWYEYSGSDPEKEDIEINATNFPDENFRSWLLSQSYGADDILTDEEIANVTSIDVHFENIQSLQGIELFTELKELDCSRNQLTVLDVSINTALQTLFCYDNQLTALDVSNNIALQTLACRNNQLTALNVTGCSNLTYIDCYGNQIKGAGMDALVESLPAVNNGKMYVINIENEQNEMTIDQVEAAKSKGWTPYYKTGSWWWEEYAGSEPLPEGILVDKSNFPDENFRGWILSREYGKDGVLTEEEIAGITSINVGGPGFFIGDYRGNIQSLKGIEYFTALQELDCHSNKLTELDVSKNPALKYLNCDWNRQLTSLNLTGCAGLAELSCCLDSLAVLNVSECPALIRLKCYSNRLMELNLSQNTALEKLDCKSNQLTALDVSNNIALTELYCSYNELTTLNISGCTALTELLCAINKLTILDVSGFTVLEELDCSENLLNALDASGLYCVGRIELFQESIGHT